MLLTFATCFAAAAANVTGQVVDNTGEPLPGVSVMVVGSATMGTTTDLDGNYTLAGIPDDATLRFSYVGFVSQDQKVAGRKTVDVTLLENNQVLEEVVVIGYGAAKAKDLTAPITVVQGEDLAVSPPRRLWARSPQSARRQYP